MAARNSERLINLVIALLVTPRYISRETVRDLVEGYSQAKTDVAFQRMFERDKEDLRALGVEIQVGPTDPHSDEMDGYRIRPDDFYLPPIHLTAPEATLVSLASSVWNESMMAHEVGKAMTKLSATGAETSPGGLSYLAPQLTATDSGFAILWEALLTRTPVGFTYHGRRRRFHPWRMISRTGVWYVLGQDVTVGEPRMFRLSRLEDQPTLDGTPGSYVLPDPQEIARHAASLEPGPSTENVLVAIREAAAGGLRSRGVPADAEAPAGYDAIRIPYARQDEIVSAICSAGPDAIVLEPGPVRDQVVSRLRAVVGLALSTPQDAA
ncbi:MAG: WYL domain-containing protein [Propionibacteriaceae bacterium]|nr:WYL domain-containing protein [Propionibacteriaceae bacterium]